MLPPQDPAAGTQVPPGTANSGKEGRWAFRGTALVLAVILLGANAAPATCAASAARWLEISASGIPGDCCGGAVRPVRATGAILSDDSKGCCCPPGAPCSVTREPGGSQGVPPESTSRVEVSESPGRDVDQISSSPRKGAGTPARCQPQEGQLFLRIGVLRI